MTHVSRCLAAAASLLAVATTGAETLTPHALLDRMNDAVRHLDYEGHFVVQSGDHLDALYLVHRAAGGLEKERVVSLTGEPREIIRSDEAVACLASGGDRKINVDRRAHGRSFSPLRGVSADQLNRAYSMQLLEADRVAGRQAHQILIQPRDALRFGYRLSLDQQTGLPLRSVMFDDRQQVVSQMMFVELRINQAITPIERDLSAMQVAKAERPKRMPLERLAPPAWSFSSVPPGFHLNVHRRRSANSGAGDVEHFIFSDGLASVSVYVQPAGTQGSLIGESRLGSANAVGRLFRKHEVVAVGEVPYRTLHWFTEHIQAVER